MVLVRLARRRHSLRALALGAALLLAGLQLALLAVGPAGWLAGRLGGRLEQAARGAAAGEAGEETEGGGGVDDLLDRDASCKRVLWLSGLQVRLALVGCNGRADVRLSCCEQDSVPLNAPEHGLNAQATTASGRASHYLGDAATYLRYYAAALRSAREKAPSLLPMLVFLNEPPAGYLEWAASQAGNCARALECYA